jgi:hypothetical protein
VLAADLGSLQPLLAARADALSAELQAMLAARLEVVFQPLRDLVAAMQGCTDQAGLDWSSLKLVGTNGSYRRQFRSRQFFGVG